MKNNKQNQSLVSVVMPVYNGSLFIGEAIESILGQTYKNFELIIVNDGSKDNSLKTIKHFAKRYPEKIKVISYKKNKGESAAANIGFKASKGEFIARMDADDIAYPTKLEKQVAFMLKNPLVIVVGAQADVINEQGQKTGTKSFPLIHQRIYEAYGYYHPMLHPACLFRRSLLPNQKKLWQNNHEPNDDYYTLFGLLSCGQFANLPQKLIAYRIHANNKSLQNPKAKVLFFIQIRRDAICDFGYQPSFKVIFANLIQFFGVLILPKSLIVPLYLFARGMSANNPLVKLVSKVNFRPLPFRKIASLPSFKD